jgi:hypothetical protein
MSFWCNTTGYKSKSKNGSTYLNVGGVPGGMSNIDIFIRPISRKLEKEGMVITNNVVNEAMKRFSMIDNLKKLKVHLGMPNSQWQKCLWGEPSSLSVEDEYNYPGAAYLVWWLKKNEGKKINNKFSY